MKTNIKPILTAILLAFAGITLVVQATKAFRSVEMLQFQDGLNVVCTHATQRCPTCTTIQRLTEETLDENFKDELANGKIVFRDVNYEHSETVDLAKRFEVATATVLLVEVKNGEIVGGKNLVTESWKLFTDEPAFKKMLKEQIEAMLQGKSLDSESEPEEMIFDLDDESIDLPL